MKKNIIYLIALVLIAMTSCNKEWSEELAGQAQRDAVVSEKHIAPVDGTFGNAEVQFRCKDSFFVDWAGQHFEGTHFCHSTYRIHGGDVEANVVNLNGCYAIERGNVVGTNLHLSFVEDKVEAALAVFNGIDDPIDYSMRFRPCHYEPYQICFDKEAKKITVYGENKEDGDTSVASGEWYGVIVVTDTVHVSDTIIVHDTIHMRDTITIHDTVVIGDTTTVRTTRIMTEHINWNPTAQLSGNKIYVYGTDRATRVDSVNGREIGRWQTTYQHRSRFAVSGLGLSLTSYIDTCVNLINGRCYVRGHQITTIWEADEIVDNTVILNGVNYKSQLTPCHCTAVQWCLSSNGNMVCHFEDASGEVATYATNYTVETPTNPLFPNALGAWASDEYLTAVVENLSQRKTNVIVIESYGSSYKYFRAELRNGLTRADFDSVVINATEYSWITSKISNGYVPAIVASHNSSAEHRGAVKSVELSAGIWQLTYDIQNPNVTAYVMSTSAWTIAGYNGRDANRGVMNQTTGKLIAEGVTLQIR